MCIRDSHEWFVVALLTLDHGLLKHRQRPVILWIKALADDVVVDLGRGDVIEPPLGHLPVAAAVDVHNDLRRRVARAGLDAANTGLEKAGDVVPDLGLIVGREIAAADPVSYT